MDRSTRPTLKDVASAAGVSTTTASYALNGRTAEMRISEKTAARVRRAAVDLGFRPNRTAQSLRTRRSRTVGLISDYVVYGEHAGLMLAGASAAARSLDHLIVIGEAEGDPELEALLIREMREHGVDGIVYATQASRRITVPEALSGVACVLLNCVDPEARVPAVIPDEVEGGRLAARIVLDSGATERIVVVGRSDDPNALADVGRLAGIHAELATAGLEVARQVPCEWEVNAAFDAIRADLRDQAPPSAVICLNDRIAMGAYEAFAGAGLRVPTDVSVVSFDGSSLAHTLRPALTSVAIPFDRLGSTAITMLLQPGGAPNATIEVSMPVHEGLSVRTPSAPAAVDDRPRV